MRESHRLLTPEEVAEYLCVTKRRVYQLPLKRVRVSEQVIRYRLEDLFEYLGIEDPNEGEPEIPDAT